MHAPEYLSTRQAAAYLNLSRSRLEIWRHEGQGPPYCKLGRSVRYHRPSLDAWALSCQRDHSTAEAV